MIPKIKKFKNLDSLLNKKNLLPYALISPAMIILIIMGIAPLIYAIVLSLKSLVLTEPGTDIFIGLGNFAEIFQNPKFWMALKRTIYYVSASVTISFIIGLIVALLLNNIGKGKFIYRSVLIVPMVLPPIVIGFAFRFMYNYDFGIINYFLSTLGIEKIPFLAQTSTALFSVIIADVWQWTPFMTLVLLAGLEVIPEELFEAGKIDGASSRQLFFYITLPNIRPVILIGLLIRVMDAFRAFDKIFIMTRGGPGESSETLSLYIWKTGLSFFKISEATAMAIILLIIILIISQVFVKTMSRGETT